MAELNGAHEIKAMAELDIAHKFGAMAPQLEEAMSKLDIALEIRGMAVQTEAAVLVQVKEAMTVENEVWAQRSFNF